MEENEILDRLNKENKTYVPDSRNKIVHKAKSQGLLQLEGMRNETVHNGNTASVRRVREIWFGALFSFALVAVLSIIIGLSIGFGKAPAGGFTPPVIEKPGDGYSVGAVATAKLMFEYFGEEQEEQPAAAKLAKTAKLNKPVSRSPESGIENFGVYFSAFDSFFTDDMLNTVYNPLEECDFENEAVIYGKYPNGAAAEFKMFYNEIYDMDTSTEDVANLVLDGYISLGYNSGFTLSGKRTVAVIDGEEVQTSLEICAYRSFDDKSCYAKMELTEEGFKFTVVINGETESEAVMYRPADSENAAYVVEIAGEDGGKFTVGMPTEGSDEVTVDYVNGEKTGQFYTKTANKKYGFILCDYLVYLPSADGSYWSVSGCNAERLPADGAVVIPAYVQGKPIKAISSYAFANKYQITSVIMPDTVEGIGDSAFYRCTRLTDVVLSFSIKYIPVYCFYWCEMLKNINLHDGIEQINSYAFYYCRAYGGFELPENLNYVGYEAFYRCKGNRELKIGEKFNSMSAGAFSDWEDLQTITVEAANTAFKSINNCLVDTRYNRLYTGCANSVIPADGSVKSIALKAFYNCKVKSVNVPPSVEAIGAYAFSECKELTQITLPDKKIEIGVYAFAGCGYYENISNWDGRVLYIGKHLISGKIGTSDIYETITIKKGTLTIAEEAFSGCNFNSIVFNSELLYIGKGIIVGSRIETLSFDGENGFYVTTNNCLIDIGQRRLMAAGTRAVIPDDGSVEIIGYGAMVGNMPEYEYNEEPFIIPASIYEIESYAFSGGNFNEIIFQSFAVIQAHAFTNCFVTEIVFKSDVDLWQYAFEYCYGLESITFESEEIGFLQSNSFYDCPDIKVINFNGTMDMWRQCVNGAWYDEVADIRIHCADGTLDKWGHEVNDDTFDPEQP